MLHDQIKPTCTNAVQSPGKSSSLNQCFYSIQWEHKPNHLENKTENCVLVRFFTWCSTDVESVVIRFLTKNISVQDLKRCCSENFGCFCHCFHIPKRILKQLKKPRCSNFNKTFSSDVCLSKLSRSNLRTKQTYFISIHEKIRKFSVLLGWFLNLFEHPLRMQLKLAPRPGELTFGLVPLSQVQRPCLDFIKPYKNIPKTSKNYSSSEVVGLNMFKTTLVVQHWSVPPAKETPPAMWFRKKFAHFFCIASCEPLGVSVVVVKKIVSTSCFGLGQSLLVEHELTHVVVR